MQDRSYSDLKALIEALAGISSFTSDEDTKIKHLINRRASQAYNTSPSWPRYLVSSEPRDVLALSLSLSDTSSVNQNYKLLGTSDGTGSKDGTNVYKGVTTDTVIIYKNSSDEWIVATGGTTAVNSSTGEIQVTNTGSAVHTEQDTIKKADITDVEEWSSTLSVLGKNLIPFDQTNKNNIGEFIRIHRKQAFLNNSSIEYDFFVDSTGANIMNISNSQDNVAFVTYKKELSTFDENSTDIPGEFFHYLAHATYADFLRMDGQHGKALTEEDQANTYLDSQLEMIDLRSNNNSINKKFSTYVNRQRR